MGFSQLRGNDGLKAQLQRSLENGRISHFYLICGPEESDRLALARALAQAILCTGREKPCKLCPSCRKIGADTHPDFITVDDPEKKTVPVELIRQARADMYVRPNESDWKIYLFPRAQDMGVPGQNALLKVLEEPPEYGVFLLLSDSPEKLLPTVRSRCTLLRLNPPKKEAGEYAEQTAAFAECFSQGDSLGLAKLLMTMEKWKRDQLIPVLNQWLEILTESLSCRAGLSDKNSLCRSLAGNCNPQKLMAATEHLEKAILYAGQNVSVGAICGYLSWQLR